MDKIKLLRQSTSAECGLCCISMVAEYFGFVQPISFYREKFNVGRDGISVKELYLILENINLTPRSFTVNNLEEFSFKKDPYILYTKENHFVVVKLLARGLVSVLDPSKGKSKMTLDQLESLSGGLLFYPQPTPQFKKNKKKLSDFRHIRTMFLPVRKSFFAVMTTSILAYGLSLFIPRALENVINLVVSSGTIVYSNIVRQLVLLALVYFSLFQLKNLLMVKLQKDLGYNLSIYTIKHLLNLPYAYFDDRGEGNILFRIGLLSQIQEIISGSFVQVIINFVSMIVVATYITIRYPFLLPILILVLSVLSLFLIISNIHILSIRQDEIAARSEVNELQTEIVTSIFQIKTSRLINYFDKYYDITFSKYNNISARTQRKIDFFNLIVTVFTTFVPLFIILFVVSNGNVSVGELFFIYSVIGMLFSYTTSFFSEGISIFMIKPSLFYLNDMFDEEKMKLDGEMIPKDFKSLEVSNLFFKYNDTTGEILKNISLKIGYGEKVSIVGLSGSGKSTLIKLLSGLYTKYRGEILLNNICLTKISNTFFQKSVAVVPQNPTIFHKTIRENIRLNDETVSDEEIWTALSLVNLEETINKLPLGLNTKLSNKGANFSGGQAQRLAIARAIVKRPKLLILDEATSSLDSINESIIYNNLKEMGITFLIVSHRLSTVTDSERIYVLEDGEIVESGSHNELLENRKGYYDLYKKQSQDESYISEEIIL